MRHCVAVLVLSLGCGGRARMAHVDDGSVAMLKGVESDCGYPVIAQPEHCVWTRPLDTRIERVAVVKIVVEADGRPTTAVDPDEEDAGATTCAMALRFISGGGACTVRLHLARHVTDVGPARRIDPSIDCSGWGGSGAGCITGAGPAPLR